MPKLTVPVKDLEAVREAISDPHFKRLPVAVESVRVTPHPAVIVALALQMQASATAISPDELKLLKLYREKVFPGPDRLKSLGQWAAYVLASAFLYYSRG